MYCGFFCTILFLEMSAEKIGFFDSGLGGLTVWRAVRNRLPAHSTVYYGDTLHLPYGDKSDTAIQTYSAAIVAFLKEQGCSTIVIACNSASAAAGSFLEQEFPDLDFINVIDPVVQYLHMNSKARKVGLLGTRATVRSGAYASRLFARTQEVDLVSLSTPLLVPLIEDGFMGTGIEREVLKHYLADPKLEHIEALVPGCTHYPLLESCALELLKGVEWVDAPALVADEVVKRMAVLNVHREVEEDWFLSDKTESFLKMAQEVFGIYAEWQELRLNL